MSSLFYLPHGILETKLGNIANVMKLNGLGGKLNGKLVTMRRAVVTAVEDSNEARKHVADEYTKKEKNASGELVPVKVPKRDAEGNIVYKKDENGNTVHEDKGGEMVPVTEYDPAGIALTDPEAFTREFNELLNEDIEVSCPALTAAELLVIQSKGTAEHADGVFDLSESSPYLKPKAERDAIAAARRAKNPRFARKSASSPAPAAEGAVERKLELVQESSSGANDSDEPILSESELNGSVSPEPSETVKA